VTGDQAGDRVRIPADVGRPDKLLAGLTARQLAILAVAGVALWAIYMATRHVVPVAGFAAVAVPVGGVATLLAVGRVEGQPADRLVVAAWRQLRSPRRLVPAPQGVPAAPAWVAAPAGSLPAPLRLPLTGIDAEGIVDLGADGLAMICRASSVTFSLRTPAEQEALVAGFARWCNSLAEPAQIVVRAEPVDLTPMIDSVLEAAPGLPHPGLEQAAREHARFLTDLAARRTLLRREVLVVLRQPPSSDGTGDGARERLRRRAAEAVTALAAAGVTLGLLDGAAATGCLWRAVDPASPPRPPGSAAAGEIVTAPTVTAQTATAETVAGRIETESGR
jgi:hypothetical protein